MGQQSILDESKKSIFGPEQRVTSALALLQDRFENRDSKILTGLPSVADELVAWRPGDLIGVLGYTSNGKTSLLNYIIDQHSKFLASHNRDKDIKRIILRFSWENSIEELTLVDMARVIDVSPKKLFSGDLKENELAKVKVDAATIVTGLPVFIVGTSIKEVKKRKMLTMTDVYNITDYIESLGRYKIDFVVLDYLQRIEPEVTGDMRAGFMDIVNRAKSLSYVYPTVLLSQAKRDVFYRQNPQPELPDAQETSNFEQSCSHILSVFMPKQKFTIGKTIPFKGMALEVYDKLLLLKVLKQTMGNAPMVWPFELGYGGTYLIDVPQRYFSTKKEKTDGRI